MRANSHKAAAYCLPRDNNNNSGGGGGGNQSHKVGISIHPPHRNLRTFRRRAISNSPSRLAVWTLIVTVISMHYCPAMRAAQVDSPPSSNGVELARPPRPEVRNDDSDVISASEILTNPMQPTRRRGETTNSSDQRATQAVSDSGGGGGRTQPVDIVSAAGAAPPAGAHSDGDQQQQGQEGESLSQQTSRLLLQLLVLGLFILVSSALIIVYSIKFCVCQRRKERRLLRRALVGDLSARTSNDSHQAAAAYQQQQQHLLLSLRHPNQLSHLQLDAHQLLDDNHLLAAPADCACLQPTAAAATTTTTRLDDHHPQMISCLAGQHPLALESDPDGLHYFASASLGPPQPAAHHQPRLILALLNRLQHLLALSCDPDQSPAIAAAQVGSPQQLSQLIVAQLQAQFSSASFLGLGQHQHHQVACMCPHSTALAANNLRDSQAIGLARSQSPSRPPAYSELFTTSTAATGNDASGRPPAPQDPE